METQIMLSTLNNILFPTDFSENANTALEFAAEIAAETGASLNMMYCVEEPFDLAPMVKEKKQQIVEKVTASFEKTVSELKGRKKFKGLQIGTKLVSGHPVVNILEEASDGKADLIVMGTRGASGSRKLVFGSLSTGIILQSEVPVLVIPEGSNFNKFKQVIFTTDFHEGDFEAVKKVVGFTELFKSKLRIVHIAPDRNLNSEIKYRGFRELLTEAYPDAKLKFDLKYENDFFSGIADYLNEQPADLMVLVRYKKTFWESLVSRNYTKELGFYSVVPLLVLAGETVTTESGPKAVEEKSVYTT